MTTTSVSMTLEKETKGTVRYAEQNEDDNPVIGTLYMKKAALRGQRPPTIEITIQWED